MIDAENYNKVRAEIVKVKKRGGRVVVLAKDENFNRQIFDNKDVDILVGVEKVSGKGKLKSRESGLNQVLCKIAVKNGVKIGIDFSVFLKLEGKELSDYIGKVMQNVYLCKKYKVEIVLVNTGGKGVYDLRSFMLSLGADTMMAKKAVDERFDV